MKERVVPCRRHRADRRVAMAEGVVVMITALDEFAHIPFEIGRRGGAGLDVDEAIVAETRGHEDVFVVDGRLGEDLVDRPGAGDDRGLARPNDARAHGAGDDVEIAGDDGRALRQPRRAGRLARHMAGDRGRVEEARQLLHGVVEAVERQKLGVIFGLGHACQPGARHVGDPLAGEAEGDEVLAEHHRRGAPIKLRRIRLDPSEQRRGLGGPGLLQADRMEGVGMGGEALGRCRRAGVEGLDAEHRLASTVDQIEPVAMPGAADAGDLARIDPGRLDTGADRCLSVPPEFSQIPLHMARTGRLRMAVDRVHGDLAAAQIEEDGLDDRVAGIEAKKIAVGLSHCCRCPRQPRHRRPDGSSPSAP